MSEITERLKLGIADRYLIERELGEGGMATVYLAHDVRHDREVALKVLRPELAAVIGAERFLQEIKVTAKLQHSHILPLYDSGVAEGFLFYVMPYVEGETLRDLLTREKQLGIDEAVTLTRAVAAALEHAHKHGVIHRDIKPENILMRDGDPVIADFGIALALSHAGHRMTETGLSIGTPQYMSPEQAMGDRDLDARSDVYSLGAVLYELLTGDPPYTASTAQAIVAKVITEKAPPVSMLRDTVPEHVSAAIQKALAKLPADRFHSAADFAEALVTPGVVRIPATQTLPAATPSRRIPLVHRAGWGVAVALAALAAWLALRPPPPAPVTRYGLDLPPGQAPVDVGAQKVSPDGSSLVYAGPGSPGAEGTQLWVKDRDQYRATPVPGTDGVRAFTWSPDGRWIAFTVAGRLQKIPIVGGAAITLADSATDNVGVAWLEDGTMVYVGRSLAELRQVPETGGASRPVFTDHAALLFPTPLPGGRGVLFTRCTQLATSTCGVWALDLRSDSAHSVVPGASLGWYVPKGDLVYGRPDGAAFAVRFDLGSLQVRGSPVPVLENVLVLSNFPIFSISASGTLVMRRGGAASLLPRYQMVWVDRKGAETPLDTTWTESFTSYGFNAGWALSPDGKQLAIGLSTDAGDDIWLKQLPHGPLSRISYDSAAEYRPRWMPNGRDVMFASSWGGLYRRAANGTGQDSLILRTAEGVYEAQWSPDGKWLVYRTGSTLSNRDIVGIRPGIDTVPVPVVATRYDEAAIAISPTGRLLAYQSDETGRTEVFLRPFPNTNGGKWLVSNGGGIAPLWSKDGRELYYVDAKRDMVAVPVGDGPDPRAGPGHVLFHMHDEWYLGNQEFYTPYDVAPDGRFLMAKLVTQASSVRAPLIVVDNWFTELKARMKNGG